jgi:hypothetical protein
MRKSFIALAALTVIGIAGAGWAVWDEERSNLGQSLPRGPIFAELSAPGAKLDEIAVTAPGYKLDLVRQGDQWVAASNGNYPARADTANNLVKQIASLQLREAKTRNPLWYGRVDVEDAGAAGSNAKLVHLVVDGAGPVDLLVGKRSSSVGNDPTGATFVRRPGDAQTWLAEGMVTIPDVFSDWFDQVIHVPGPEVQEVSIREGATVVFDAAKENGATSYTLKSVDPRYADKGKFANDSRVKGLEAGIVSVAVDDVRPADSVTFAPDARTVHFRTGDGLTVDARLGTADGKTWVAYTATAESGSSRAADAEAIRKRTQGWAFLLTQAKIDALATPLDQLLQAQAAVQPTPDMGGMGGMGGAPGNFLTPEQMQNLLRQQAPMPQ